MRSSLDGLLVLVHLAQRLDDALLRGRGASVVRVELDEEALGLDGALVARLGEERVGQLGDDLARVHGAADRRQEVEGVLGPLALVLGEHLHQVLERLALELLEALAAPLGELMRARLRLGVTPEPRSSTSLKRRAARSESPSFQ